MREYGSIHGRFQPFHNEHLEYLIEAKKRSHKLLIGITQYNIRNLNVSVGSKHRHEPVNNPLTYQERTEIIKAVLIAEQIPEESFSFLPFPIDNPKLLPDFLSPRVPVYTTICDEWNEKKISLLQAAGYEVIVLFKRSIKKCEGKRIRQLIINDDDSWKEFLPEPAVEYLEKLQIGIRLKALSKRAG